MPRLITIYWRDIPAQVLCRAGRGSYKRMLAQRFQQAIDRAAMRAGRGSSDAYLEDWRRETEQLLGDPEAAVEARAARLEAEYPAELLENMVRAAGVRPGGGDGRGG
jgi:hypothetical protein